MEESDEDVDVKISYKTSYQSDIGEYFKSLTFNQHHSDIVIICDKRAYPCHKVCILRVFINIFMSSFQVYFKHKLDPCLFMMMYDVCISFVNMY